MRAENLGLFITVYTFRPSVYAWFMADHSQ
jgi:hypothetical protein